MKDNSEDKTNNQNTITDEIKTLFKNGLNTEQQLHQFYFNFNGLII